jgi:single-strand DNA-binding protein
MNNQCTLIGYVGQEPKSVVFGDTKNKVVKFSIAVKEFSANKEDLQPLWLDVDAWNGLGDRVLETIAKGREVAVIGRLSTYTYAKEIDGVKHQITKPVLKLSSFHLCGKKPTSEEPSPVKKSRLKAS